MERRKNIQHTEERKVNTFRQQSCVHIEFNRRSFRCYWLGWTLYFVHSSLLQSSIIIVTCIRREMKLLYSCRRGGDCGGPEQRNILFFYYDELFFYSWLVHCLLHSNIYTTQRRTDTKFVFIVLLILNSTSLLYFNGSSAWCRYCYLELAILCRRWVIQKTNMVRFTTDAAQNIFKESQRTEHRIELLLLFIRYCGMNAVDEANYAATLALSSKKKWAIDIPDCSYKFRRSVNT